MLDQRLILSEHDTGRKEHTVYSLFKWAFNLCNCFQEFKTATFLWRRVIKTKLQISGCPETRSWCSLYHHRAPGGEMAMNLVHKKGTDWYVPHIFVCVICTAYIQRMYVVGVYMMWVPVRFLQPDKHLMG